MLNENRDYLPAQIFSINSNMIIAKTENNQYIQIDLSDAQKSDPIFWETLQDILTAKIWIPITKSLHQLTQFDWLIPEQTIAYS